LCILNLIVIFQYTDNAKERCPVFPSNAKTFHHNFPDPAKTKGSEDEIMHQFRKVRNIINPSC
jgi:arsenate reductase